MQIDPFIWARLECAQNAVHDAELGNGLDIDRSAASALGGGMRHGISFNTLALKIKV
jgi:hypothetical protein